jgi:hypothetical protein
MVFRLSGGIRLDNLIWQPFTNGILQAQVPADLPTEEIFINGERQILARYPNFDPKAKYFDGFAADAIPRSGRALVRSSRRLLPRHAPGVLGRLHLAHHRQGPQRRTHSRRWLAKQSRRGGTSDVRFVETSLRNSTRPVSGFWMPRPTRSISIRPPDSI